MITSIPEFDRALEAAADLVEELMDVMKEAVFFIVHDPPWYGSRAQAIEQTYRTEIKRLERERPFQRIYKPP